MTKVIFHLDIDAFFVSAHQTIKKSLINKPIVVSNGGHRSIVSAASYEAKKLGIKIPMPLYKAKKMIPNLIIINPLFSLYINLSTKLFELIGQNYTSLIEVASIDECYIDVTTIWQKYQSPYKLAKDMQKKIWEILHLPCSIGISDNKFVAKMASPINKPNGITIIKPHTFPANFWHFEVKKCLGIGKSTSEKLIKNNIKTIGDLANTKLELLNNLFGKRGLMMKNNANGQGESKLSFDDNEPKSIGNSLTFADRDKNNREDILETLAQLSLLVASRAQQRNLAGYIVNVTLKTAGSYEIKKHGKQVLLKTPIRQSQDIYREGVKLFDQLWNGQTIKYIGITLHKLIDIFANTMQSSLFEQKPKLSKVNHIINYVNNLMQQKVLITSGEQLVNNKKPHHQSRYLMSDQNLKHYDK